MLCKMWNNWVTSSQVISFKDTLIMFSKFRNYIYASKSARNTFHNVEVKIAVILKSASDTVLKILWTGLSSSRSIIPALFFRGGPIISCLSILSYVLPSVRLELALVFIEIFDSNRNLETQESDRIGFSKKILHWVLIKFCHYFLLEVT